MKLNNKLLVGLIAFVAIATSANAQTAEKPWMVEALVGTAVPTFDITDLADPGFASGLTVGYSVNDRLMAMAELDWGTHGGADGGPDVAVYHYMAKAGLRVFESADGKWRILVNAGAGAMTFDVDAPGVDSNTYFAINAGAKVYYQVTDLVNVVISPQGDIGFVSEDDGFTGSTAWVWPITAGVGFSF
jgi:hypothetical protein